MIKHKLRYDRIPAEFEFAIKIGAGLVVIDGKIAENGQVKRWSSYNQRFETWEEIENLRDQLTDLLEKRPKGDKC